jgi:MFS transporter, AAHS family, 4-hydroxybenzoate transporter
MIGVAVSGSELLLFVAIFLAGFCVVGGQSGVNALGAYCYPTAMRTTGMGWASGIGRFGSVAGPIVGGALLSLGWGVQPVFFGAALAGVLSILAVGFLGSRVDASPAEPSAAAQTSLVPYSTDASA